MRSFVLFLLIIPLLVLGQVKEVNFLGKSWYLHGYDFRINGRIHSENYLQEVVHNANYPSEAYQNVYSRDSMKWVTYPSIFDMITNVSAGFVFRPFHQTDIKFIRQIEFSQNFFLSHSSLAADYTYSGAYGSENIAMLRTFQIGYNPRLMISSPTFAEYLKLYLIAEGTVQLPIYSTVYNQIDRSFLLNPSEGYSKQDIQFTDRLNAPHYSAGLGYGVGIKMNVTCNWNFHIEANRFNLLHRHTSTKTNSSSSRIGVQVGLRYKFGIPDPNDSDGKQKPSGFW